MGDVPKQRMEQRGCSLLLISGPENYNFQSCRIVHLCKLSEHGRETHAGICVSFKNYKVQGVFPNSLAAIVGFTYTNALICM